MATATQADLARSVRELPGMPGLLAAATDIGPLHLVGGVPRDLLLGRGARDLDLVAEGDGVAAARTLAARLGGEVSVHDRFGTATVSAPGLTFDVASARAERYPAPGALPDVRPAGLDEDLLRRDVTVNAIAITLTGDSLGVLRAAPGALADLDARRLRVLHPASFTDDPTRLLRLVRYAARLGFSIEPDTAELARRAAADGALATLSAARLGAELRLLVAEPTATDALLLARELGIEGAIHPDFRLDADRAAAALDLLPADGRRDLVVLAACCLRIDPEPLAAWLDAAELPAGDREVVVAAVRTAPGLAERLASAGASASAIAAAVGSAGVESVALAGGTAGADAARRWLGDVRHVRLAISGDDLRAAGIPQGPAIGRGLAAALAARVDGRAVGREAELAVALAAATQG